MEFFTCLNSLENKQLLAISGTPGLPCGPMLAHELPYDPMYCLPRVTSQLAFCSKANLGRRGGILNGRWKPPRLTPRASQQNAAINQMVEFDLV